MAQQNRPTLDELRERAERYTRAGAPGGYDAHVLVTVIGDALASAPEGLTVPELMQLEVRISSGEARPLIETGDQRRALDWALRYIGARQLELRKWGRP